MDRQRKLAVGGLVAIVALFSGSVALGGGAGDGSLEDTRTGVVAWLGNLFGDPPSVARADITADCLTDRTFTVDGSCLIRIAPSDERQRSLKVRAVDAVTVTAPAAGSTVEADLAAGDESTVSVDGEGADVTVTCAGKCTLDLVGEE